MIPKLLILQQTLTGISLQSLIQMVLNGHGQITETGVKQEHQCQLCALVLIQTETLPTTGLHLMKLEVSELQLHHVLTLMVSNRKYF